MNDELTPAFVFFTLIALIEAYYWFIWLPKNKHTLREYKDFERYVDQVWKKGRGIE